MESTGARHEETPAVLPKCLRYCRRASRGAETNGSGAAKTPAVLQKCQELQKRLRYCRNACGITDTPAVLQKRLWCC